VRIPRISTKDATGFYDKLVGLGKEIFGVVVDEDRLITAGEAQQDKGTEKLKALRAQAQADAHRAKAKVHESRERAVQATKAG
jgi:uncharacterized protein YjbJ (UPF0337 family)